MNKRRATGRKTPTTRARTAATRKARRMGASTKRVARRPAGAGRILRASDLMTRNPIVIPASMTVGALCDLLQEKNINGAPVVDGRGRLVGVVTQEDIIYGAMGHAGAPGFSGWSRPGAPQPAALSRATAPLRRPGRRVVAMLRGRGLGPVQPAEQRPGEKPFWSPANKAPDSMAMPVSGIMTSPAISAEEHTPIADLCRIMWSLRIHRVPILKAGRVTGLISSMDLCRAILEGTIRI